MEYTRAVGGEVCKVVMSGKFTFADHVEFKKIINIFSDPDLQFIKFLEIDLSKVEFVDSAALGLLLLVLDAAQKRNAQLTLVKPQGQVQKMFKISRFYEIFTVVD